MPRSLHKEFEHRCQAVRCCTTRRVRTGAAAGPAGGWHYAGDAHLRPDRLMTALAGVLRSRGVEILEETSVSRITLENGRARAVETVGRLVGSRCGCAGRRGTVARFRRATRLPDSDSAGQGLFDHAAAAAHRTANADHLRRVSRGSHALGFRHPRRLHDGIRRLRFNDQSAPHRAVQAGRRGKSGGDAAADRSKKNGAVGGR